MKVSDIKIYEEITDEELLKKACKKARINPKDIADWHIIKKSIDARDKKNVHYNYSLEIFLNDEKSGKNCNDIISDETISVINVPKNAYQNNNDKKRPVVVGAGPAGLFCAYVLSVNGAKPILLEQGKSVDERVKDVENFLKNRTLNTKSNVQFGEGGAGTFSDGKLTTNVNSPLNKVVLEVFVKFGAPKEILYLNKPHIGTDNIRKVVKNIREEIIRLGGDVRFNSKVVDFGIKNGKIESAILEDGALIATDTVVLAIGHSARDIFKKLDSLNVKMEPKPFSVGVRIEHKQDMINKSQYGEYTKLKLPPADYKLVYHAENGRTLYTFCMCPGGEVIASSSEDGTIVTNGMSFYKRDKENANSALLVNVNIEDYLNLNYTDNGSKVSDALKGMYFQKELEEKAFKMAGSNYNAPVQKVGDFINNCTSNDFGDVEATYKPGTTLCNLNDLFPNYISNTLKDGLLYFDKKIKGFAMDDAIMTAVESRSSSPVRILRDEKMTSSVLGIYPCGEGAGYAGGIMTSAMDGIKVALSVLNS